MMFALNQPKDRPISVDSLLILSCIYCDSQPKISFTDSSSKPALFDKVAIHKCLFKFKFELIKLK